MKQSSSRLLRSAAALFTFAVPYGAWSYLLVEAVVQRSKSNVKLSTAGVAASLLIFSTLALAASLAQAVAALRVPRQPRVWLPASLVLLVVQPVLLGLSVIWVRALVWSFFSVRTGPFMAPYP